MINYYNVTPAASPSLLMNALLLKSSLRRHRRVVDALLASPTTTATPSSFVKKHGRYSLSSNSTTSPSSANNKQLNYTTPSVVSDDQNPAQGKRQRRQAAATLVQNFPSWTGVGKKSKAQPRPAVQIPPRGIGPVAEPNENDVLCGRGGRINSHEGNVQFRDVVNDTKKNYLAKSTKKLEKAHIAAGVVQQIRNMEPSGRFLKEDSESGMWWDIGDAKAIKKVGQALREDAPDIREDLVDEDGNKIPDSGDPKSPGGADKKTAAKKSPRAVSSGKHVIVLPTTRSNRRGEDVSDGALPPQRQLSQQANGLQQYQQVLPSGSGASLTQVSLPSMGPPSHTGVMYPPSSNNSNSSATLRHGQFSLRGQGAMSQKATEMMNQQQQMQQQNNMMMHQNGNGAFGRPFIPPSEMSLGSHGSSVSGLSGFTNSLLMNETLLSGLSDGVSSLTAGDASYRQLAAAVASGQRVPGLNQQQLATLHAMHSHHQNQQQQQANNMNNANNTQMNNINMNANNMNVGMFQQRNANMGSNGSVFSGGSRGSNGFNNYSLTSGNGAGSNLGGSDLSGHTMPQAAAIFGRTSSHNDLSSLMGGDGSMAGHSLVGGGIRNSSGFGQLNDQFQQQQLQQQLMQQQQLMHQQQNQQAQQQQHQQQQQQQVKYQKEQQQQQVKYQKEQQQQHNDESHLDGMDASFMSGNSLASRNRGSSNFKDGMDFSVFSGASLSNSVANRSARGPANPAAAAYVPASARYSGDASVAGRSRASNYSIGAMSQSIASMSLHSGGASVASFSAHSMMSDFSDTLLALDLAENNSKVL